MVSIEEYLRTLAHNDGSDLYLSTGAPPCAKFQGVLKPLSQEALKPGECAAIAEQIMDEEQRKQFAHELEMNLAISMAGAGVSASISSASATKCRLWRATSPPTSRNSTTCGCRRC